MSANRYAKGQIYTIRSHQTDDVYIGSTCSPLHKRLAEHKSRYGAWKEGKYQYTSSFEIIKFDDAYVELLEDFPCDNKKELNRREGQLIRQNACVNKRVEGRTESEYYQDNKTRIYDKVCVWREENKEHVTKYHQEYHVANSDVINARARAHYEANKESITERRGAKVTCECGAVVRLSHIARHLKTERHALLLEEKCQAIL
jgi:hypothetical protein